MLINHDSLIIRLVGAEAIMELPNFGVWSCVGTRIASACSRLQLGSTPGVTSLLKASGDDGPLAAHIMQPSPAEQEELLQ